MIREATADVPPAVAALFSDVQRFWTSTILTQPLADALCTAM
jgi:hypothetical protein